MTPPESVAAKYRELEAAARAEKDAVTPGNQTFKARAQLAGLERKHLLPLLDALEEVQRRCEDENITAIVALAACAEIADGVQRALARDLAAMNADGSAKEGEG